MLLSYTPEEVVAALECCDNTNAAFKSFLKKEVQKGDPLAKLVKSFRAVWTSNNDERKLAFVTKHAEKYDGLFLNFARYALYQAINDITGTVIEKHAEDFNTTYETNGSEITILEKEKFTEIAKEALAIFRSGLSDHNLPESNFLLSVLIVSLFDDAVVPEIVAIAKG